MKLYIVRHGETDGNRNSIFQDGKIELSETGIKQTKFLANRFVHLPVDIILSSPYKRAKTTAEAIQKVNQKEIIFSDLLIEIQRPSEFIGQSRKDPKLLEIKKQFESMYHDPNHRYSDEENFHDVQNRAIKFLEYLETLDYKSIAVVSHHVFIATIIGQMTFRENFSGKVFISMYRNFAMNNTGVTVCQKKEDGTWELVTWNDHAHLAE